MLYGHGSDLSHQEPTSHWECPCGTEKRGALQPVRTIVSAAEHVCPFCGRAFKEEYRREGPGRL